MFDCMIIFICNVSFNKAEQFDNLFVSSIDESNFLFNKLVSLSKSVNDFNIKSIMEFCKIYTV